MFKFLFNYIYFFNIKFQETKNIIISFCNIFDKFLKNENTQTIVFLISSPSRKVNKLHIEKKSEVPVSLK